MVTSLGHELPLLASITLEQIIHGLDTNRFSCLDLTRAHLARIAEVNDTFKAIIQVNPSAEADARALDDERAATGRRGPLHGVPLVVKDSIMTLPFDSSAGSNALLGIRLPADHAEATVSARLREAGAVLIASANLTEFSNFRVGAGALCTGWSPRGGEGTGVFCPNQNTGGSSSGTGVATILGLALGGLGTETWGSIISPCCASGIVGIKPTPGLTPRDGVVPISSIRDTVGPMARSVHDAAVILGCIAGPSPHDGPAMHKSPFTRDTVPDYAAACRGGGGGQTPAPRLDGVRIGVPARSVRQENGFNDAYTPGFDAAVRQLRELGAEIVEDVRIGAWEEPDRSYSVTVFDFNQAFGRFCAGLAVNPNGIRSAQDLGDWIKAHGQLESWPQVPIRRIEDAAAAAPETDPAVVAARARVAEVGLGPLGFLGAMDKYRLDACVFDAAFDDSKLGLFVNIAGSPVIVVPTGFGHQGLEYGECKWRDRPQVGPGLPTSIWFAGRPFSEELLIKIAHAYEQTRTLVGSGAPYKMPTTELADVVDGRSHSG